VSSPEQQSFLDESGNWSGEAEGASLSIVSGCKTQTTSYNHVYQFDQGRWKLIENLQELPARQRGYTFIVAPVRRKGQQFLSFTCPRFIDQEMLEGVFSGLRLRDHHGNVTEDPLSLKDSFLLSSSEAREFAKRLEGLGGLLRRGQVKEVSSAQELLSLLDQQLQKLEKGLASDLTFLQLLEQGNSTGRLQFDDRGEWFRENSQKALKTISQLEEHISDSSERQLSSEDRTLLLELRNQAAAKTETLDQIRHARSRVESLAAQMLSGKQVTPTHSAVAEQILIKDLAQMLQNKGINCNEEEGVVIAEIPGQTVKLIIDETGLRLLS